MREHHFLRVLSLLAFTIGAPSVGAQNLAEQQAPTTVQAPSTSSAPDPAPAPKRGWSYDPDAGIVYQKGDFKWIFWAYGERVFRVDGASFWRRVRQGMEFDTPRLSKNYRSALVYEVDFTDTNFFRASPRWNIFENLYWTLQDAEDPARFRLLLGENTHILTYEDNLSSGNLPTINRSLILEEHGSVNSFGTQFGLQLQKALPHGFSLALSAQDNRGSLNTPNPRYVVGNDLAMKLTRSLVDRKKSGTKLTIGAGVDHTRDIRNRMFTLASAVGAEPLGGTLASGNKLTFEAYAVYAARLFGHPFTLESEGLHSSFSNSKTHVGGGYVLAQFSVFDTKEHGDLDPFLRYDWVRLGRASAAGLALQQAIRTGFNYNLPFTRKLVNFHVEYARNVVHGPILLVPKNRAFNELGFELRLNVTRYLRH